MTRFCSFRPRAAIDRGLRLVLLAFFLSLVFPAWQLTVASASEQLPASGLSGAAISVVLPVALLVMSVVIVEQLAAEGLAVWRDRKLVAWALGSATLAIASVMIPIIAGAPPIVVLILGFLVTAARAFRLAFTPH